MAASQESGAVNSVTFMSYNCTGMNSIKAQWICEVLEDLEVDYCAVQEHFKNTKTTDKFFRDKFSKYNSYVFPAHRAPGVDSGRCYNVIM